MSDTTRILRALAFACCAAVVGQLACATTERAKTDPCPPPSAELPPITEECSSQNAAYRASLGKLVGKGLMGWRSYPGYADLSIGFGASAKVQSVCLRRVRGDRVVERIPRVSGQLRNLARAPACFAGHRVEIEWESGIHTDHSVDRHERACRNLVRRMPVAAGRCDDVFGTHSCKSTQIEAIQEQTDHEVTECVLRRAPLVVQLRGSSRAYSFLPEEGTEVSGDLATQALEACSRKLPTAEAVVECMSGYGWAPSDAL